MERGRLDRHAVHPTQSPNHPTTPSQGGSLGACSPAFLELPCMFTYGYADPGRLLRLCLCPQGLSLRSSLAYNKPLPLPGEGQKDERNENAHTQNRKPHASVVHAPPRTFYFRILHVIKSDFVFKKPDFEFNMGASSPIRMVSAARTYTYTGFALFTLLSLPTTTFQQRIFVIAFFIPPITLQPQAEHQGLSASASSLAISRHRLPIS